jgi:hypothetical protein
MNEPIVPIKPGTALTPPSDALIADFEDARRKRMPASFLALVRTANGGVPLRPLFESAQGQRYVERFLPLLDKYKSAEGAYDIRVVMTHVDGRLGDDEEEVGSSIIPFAVLFAGDLVCLDFRDDPDAPTVCVWYHEESTDFHPVTETVAPSLEAFLAMMHDRADED